MPTKKRGGRPEKFSVKQVTEALRGSFGNMTVAAALLKCDRQLVYDYLHRYPELRFIRPHKRVELAEVAEGHLIAGVRAGKQWAVERVLRTVGADLGYGDQLALTGPGGGPFVGTVKVLVEYVDDGTPEAALDDQTDQGAQRSTNGNGSDQPVRVVRT